MADVLEEIAEVALANFWGFGGSAIRLGYPSKHGRPEAFHQAIAWLAQKIGVEPGSGYRPPVVRMAESMSSHGFNSQIGSRASQLR